MIKHKQKDYHLTCLYQKLSGRFDSPYFTALFYRVLSDLIIFYQIRKNLYETLSEESKKGLYK